jgi:hypothetical protein
MRTASSAVGREGLLLERGNEGGNDDGNLVAAEGSEVEQVFALLDPAEHRRAVEAHPAGEFVHVHPPRCDGDHTRFEALRRQ